MFKHPSRIAQDALHAPASLPLSDNDDPSSSESSEYETEDSDGDELTPVMDAAILRTLGRIRRGEGVEVGRNVFEEEQAALLASSNNSAGLPSDKRKHKEKPMHLADFQRRALLASASSSGAGKAGGSQEDELKPWSHADEQAALRAETLAAFSTAVDGDEAEGDDGVFVKREAGAPEDDALEDEEYRAFLVGNVGGGEAGVREALFGVDEGNRAAPAAEDDKAEKKKQKKAKKAAAVAAATGGEEDAEKRKKEEEEFLLDYILNRGWLSRETVAAPSSSTLASQTSRAAARQAARAAKKEEGSALSADEGEEEDDSEFEDKEEEFEVKYNFRFEEPGAEYITTHPRALPSLARREDTSRKTARAAKAERKAAEKLAREEAKKQKKAAKRAEIAKKLELLGMGKGGREVSWNDLDLEDEFDDAAHEAKMRELFDNANDPLEGEDMEKPTWDDEDGGQEGYLYGMPDFGDDDDGEGGEEGDFGGDGMEMEGMEEVPEDDAYDGPINMDADAPDDDLPKSSKKSKKDKAKKAKKEKAQAKAAASVKIRDDEAEELRAIAERGDAEGKKRKVDELMDEYDKLDYEDMIGNLPTRFHYAQTTPQSYGLSPAEILLATDAELNAFLGIKQYAAFRSDGGAGAGRVGRDKRLWELKKALKGRKWGEEPEPEGGKGGKKYTGTGANGEKLVGKKRKGKKERLKEQQAAAAAAGEEGEGAPSSTTAPPPPPPPPAPAAVDQGAETAKPKKKKRKVAAEMM